MSVDIATALIALFGIVLGGLLQYLFTKRSEIDKHFQGLRSQAYVDFVRATSGLAISQKNGFKDQEIEATIHLLDAKARISIYGSKKVVDSMADFFGTYGVLNSQEAVASFIEIIRFMREETVSKNEIVSDEEMTRILF